MKRNQITKLKINYVDKNVGSKHIYGHKKKTQTHRHIRGIETGKVQQQQQQNLSVIELTKAEKR